jgi:broad specificity phosphatase PhoE
MGDFLRSAGVRRLYTSPLERCQETARIACQAAEACVEVDERLIEWQPEDTPESVRLRMLAIFKQVVGHIGEANGDGLETGLVTHGGPIAMLLEALGMEATVLASYRRFDSNNPLPPAAVWQVSQAGVEDQWSFELTFIPDITFA